LTKSKAYFQQIIEKKNLQLLNESAERRLRIKNGFKENSVLKYDHKEKIGQYVS
jgi:hypothetical protein